MKKKQRGKQKKKGGMIWIIVVVLALIIGGFFLFSSGESKYSQEELDKFAKCLTEKGTVMYGAFWCPHCARTKKNFGSSFHFIEYVECDPRGDNEQSVLCIEKEIEEYDTWEFSDGSRVIGEPSFEKLSEMTGCPIPIKK
jgi:thiol-disulfide isomerase/thioredoxin